MLFTGTLWNKHGIFPMSKTQSLFKPDFQTSHIALKRNLQQQVCEQHHVIPGGNEEKISKLGDMSMFRNNYSSPLQE